MSVLETMANELLLDESFISDIVRHSRSHYRRIQLACGRVVWQPSAELSLLQYWVIDWLSSIDRSELRFATAYEPGSSIVRNAERHVGANHILAMDIKRFFPSVGARHICDYLQRTIASSWQFDDGDIAFILSIVLFHSGTEAFILR